MNQPLINFCYSGQSGESEIRSMEINGILYTSLKDITTALNLENRALNERNTKKLYTTVVQGIIRDLDQDEFLQLDNSPSSQDGEIFLTQPGLYRVLSNDKTEAGKKFQRWLFHEALPAIIKYGEYPAPLTTTSNNIEASILAQAEILQKTMKLAFENFKNIQLHQNKIDSQDKKLEVFDQKLDSLHQAVNDFKEQQEEFYSVKEYFLKNNFDRNDILEKYVQGMALYLSNEFSKSVKHSFQDGVQTPKFPEWLIAKAIDIERKRLDSKKA
ncbi:BRO-N domain-containing protein [Marinomonas dokdonensis]|uniref:BRO-N domain-containing protein n=1 Tax=Marinomonas dokdonensis TaxID=328224 RepID=UPI0040557065